MAARTQKPDNKPANKPARKFRSGALTVSIWKQTGTNGDYFTVNAQRAFTRDEGQTWEHTDSFSRDDVPVVALLMQRAWAWICTEEEKGQGAK